MGQVIGREPCPSCRESGGDNSGDNLARYEDGGAWCFVCGHKELPDKYRKRNEDSEEVKRKVTSNTDMSVYHSLPSMPVHGISQEIIDKYGIKVGLDESTRQPNKVYYPYYSEDGKLVAAKVRIIANKEFYWIGDVRKATMFGQQTLGKGGKLLVICEGEKDALALSQMFYEKGKNYNVVSIKDGANLPKKDEKLPKPDVSAAASLELISKFENVVTCFDNDRPGKLTEESLSEMIAVVTKVKNMQIPDGYKDAHDVFAGVEGHPSLKGKIIDLLAKSNDFTPEAIYAGDEISLETLKTPLAKGAEIPFKGLQDVLKGLRKGELTTVTAAPGAGKSTLSRELSYSMIKQGYRVANIFLEETLEKTAQSFIALDNNIPLPLLRSNPDAIDPRDYEDSYNSLVANGRNFFFKHFGSLDSDVLINKMRYFAKACQVDYIFLDHLSMVVSASEESNDERKLLDKICTKLAAFCTETGVGVIMVVHLRKTGQGQQSTSQGGMITLDDLRGSGGIAQLSFNVVAALRDTTSQDDLKSNAIALWVLKNREWGYTGMAGKLFYNKLTGRLEELPDF